MDTETMTCTASLNIAGQPFFCDKTEPFHQGHTNAEAGAIWDGAFVEAVQYRAAVVDRTGRKVWVEDTPEQYTSTPEDAAERGQAVLGRYYSAEHHAVVVQRRTLGPWETQTHD